MKTAVATKIQSFFICLSRRAVYWAVIAAVCGIAFWNNVHPETSAMANTTTKMSRSNATTITTTAHQQVIVVPNKEQKNYKKDDATKDTALQELLRNKFNITNGTMTDASSAIVYLNHCDLSQISVPAFYEWQTLLASQLRHNDKMQYWETHHDELTLQALEMFAVASNVCNFSNYHFSIPLPPMQVAEKIARIPQPVNRTDQARLVFLISAFDDYENLQELVQVLHLPHHLLVIHLDQSTSTEFVHQVQKMADSYTNVVVLQFGFIVYPTDTLTQIFVRIFRWITVDLQFDYDYIFTMGASSFPLWSANEMAHQLAIAERRVYIGKLHYPKTKAEQLCRHQGRSRGLFVNNRLVIRTDVWRLYQVANVRNSSGKFKIFGNGLSAFGLPGHIQRKCFRKNVSGNTAAYDIDAVRALLTNPDAMQSLAHFKFHGGCCAEESHWGAALELIGRGSDVSKHGMIWQCWPFKSSMKNLALAANENPNMCIHVFLPNGDFKVNGLESVRNELRTGRTIRGNLMARKFGSSNRVWKQWIQSNLFHPEKSVMANTTTMSRSNATTIISTAQQQQQQQQV